MESKKTFIETQAPATENPLSKEVVLKIGREIRKAYFPILREIIDAVNQVAPSYNFEIPSEVRKQIYATKSADFNIICNTIYAKHGTSLSNLDYCRDVLYKDDPEVRQIGSLMLADIDNAFLGQVDYENTIIPELLTPRKMLEIMVKYYKLRLKSLSEEYQETGKDFEAVKGDYEFTVKMDKKHRGLREELMIAEGLGDFEDHHDKIVELAMMQYMKAEDFRMKIRAVSAQYTALLPRLHIKGEELDKAIEEFGNDILENDIDEEIQKPVSTTADKI